MTALLFMLEGVIRLDSPGGTGAEGESGVLLETAHESVVTWSEGSVGAVVWLPTDAVTESGSVPPPERGLLPDTDLVAACRALAVSTVRNRRNETAVTGYVMERVFVEMGFAILLERQGVEFFEGRVPKTIDQARALLVANRGDPDYGPADLARDLHVSVRHVQRVFAREDTSPALELRRMRIDLAIALLSDRQYEPLSLTEIALHSGFRTLSTMRRAFHEDGRELGRRKSERDTRQLARGRGAQ